MTVRKPVVLAILDGWGLREARDANAPALAHTPTVDRLMREASFARLSASGADVGLPEGQMGNSEVGHTNIGAGRVVFTELAKIDKAIAEGHFARNAALDEFAERVRHQAGKAHLMALVSDGGVHSHRRHLAETVRALAGRHVPVRLHLFTDGRDVGPTTAHAHVRWLLSEIEGLPDVRVSTLMGRFWAMDRDKRWDRIERAVRCMTGADSDAPRAESARAAIDLAYARGDTDEFILPTACAADEPPPSTDDGLICANFRADRMREILGALLDPNFEGKRNDPPPFMFGLGMVEYSDRLSAFMAAMFPQEPIENTLGAWVAAHGRTQFRLAETEKYPHVTFFLNGGIEAPEPNEHRTMPASPKVKTYDLAPAMSSAEVTRHLVDAIGVGYDLIVVNYANPDMVGHTGDLSAAIAACEAVDTGLGRALDALAAAGGTAIVTADHGNCELMTDPATGGPHTAHTTNLVPVWMIGGDEGTNLADGRLADLAPTVLELMGLPAPGEMTGRSLIRRSHGS